MQDFYGDWDPPLGRNVCGSAKSLYLVAASPTLPVVAMVCYTGLKMLDLDETTIGETVPTW